MKKIKLAKGYETLVDDSDYEFLNIYNWYRYCNNGNYYAYAKNKGNSLIMHRLIMNPEKNQIIDHINGDGLDNRRNNLRIASKSTNGMNRSVQINNKSGYKGVCFSTDTKRKNPWRANITYNKKTINLGRFDTAKEAAIAYNEAALKYHGEFAKLNEIKNEEN